jgi:hypothetical protein
MSYAAEAIAKIARRSAQGLYIGGYGVKLSMEHINNLSSQWTDPMKQLIQRSEQGHSKADIAYHEVGSFWGRVSDQLEERYESKRCSQE